MSLNQLLSFLPFARRPGSDSERRAPSAAFMVFFSINLLAAVWGLMLLVSVVALFVFTVLTSDVAFFNSNEARDAEIQSIKSVTDVGLLQQKAVLDVSEGYTTGATATFLCHIALDTLLLVIIGSIGGLLLVRWMKRHLRTADDVE